ncbi:lipopolysaccharide biosynthesis protein [Vibrio furnissii]|uniref:lipopolysaccharide biosynthesis protein n=1 Tax=Vibrio furnissii TaxID=29494 RepID=UPI00374A4293
MGANLHLKKIINVAIAKILVLAMSFFVMVILARGLGADVRGHFAIILLLPNLLVSLCEGGMRQATTYLIGKARYPTNQIVTALRVFILFTSVIGMAIVYYCQTMIVSFEVSKGVLLLSSLLLPISLWISANRGILLGYEKTDKFSKTLWWPRLIYLLVISALYYVDKLNLFSVILSYIMMFTINLLQTIFYIIPLNQGVFSFKKNVLVDMLKLGFIYCISLFFIDANYKIGMLISQHTLSPNELGNYAVTIQFVELLWQVPAAIAIVLFSKSSNTKNYDINWFKMIQKTCRIQISISVIVSILISICSSWLFPLILGSSYQLVGKMFVFLIPGIVFMSMFKILNVDLAGQGKPYISLKFMPFILGITGLLAYFLSISYGYIGLCVSVTISYILSTMLMVWQYNKTTGVDLKIMDYFFVNRHDISEISSYIRR